MHQKSKILEWQHPWDNKTLITSLFNKTTSNKKTVPKSLNLNLQTWRLEFRDQAPKYKEIFS